MKKSYFIIPVIIIAGLLIILNLNFFEFDSQNNEKMNEVDSDGAQLDAKTKAWILFGTSLPFELTDEELNFLMYDDNTVVIQPIFTQTAYISGGFYDYYREECDSSCLTLPVERHETGFGPTDSRHAVRVFIELGWKIITDLSVHKNPSILSNYEKVILLHNEYVTREMFEAITSHPNVIYLYPNALYAEVEYDEENDAITLIRGHRYPYTNILNGFEWEFDNTHPYEFDTKCLNWEFYEIDNGFMLNCYPEWLIITELDLLKKIKEL